MIETVPTRISHPTPKLDQNIMLFVRLLRAIGLKLGSASMLEAIDAAKTVGVADKDFLYHALVSCLIKRREDKPLFDQAFYLFWQNPKFHERIRDLILPRIKAAGHQQEDVEPMLRRLSDALADPPDDPPNTAEDVEIDFDTEGTAADTDRLQHKDVEPMLRRLSDALADPPDDPPNTAEDVEIDFDTEGTAADTDRLQHKDFEMMSAAEIRHAEQAIANLQPKLPRRSARRSKLSSRGQLIAMRAALQHAERQGGMVIPKFRSVITKPRPLVILCDISGSMEHYSRIMLHFIHALTRNHPQVSSFLFGTRLTNISRQMRHRDVDEAVQSVSHLVDDWSGGTRISASLETFNHRWSRRVMGQGAITLLITDGLDRNPDDALGIHMERLHKSTATLLWLNPLLRFDGFAPKSHSVRTMIQHVDHFLPIHSLQAMTDLTASLAKMQTQRDAKLAEWQAAARRASLAADLVPAYAQESAYAQEKGHTA